MPVQPFLRVSPDTRSDLDLVVEIDAQVAPGELRDALRQTFGDPALELLFWLPDAERYVDLDGRVVTLPAEESHERTTFIVGPDGPLAALVHDASLVTDPAFARSVCTATAPALDDARRHTELRARLADVTGSRARIVEAAHELTELESGARRLTLAARGPAGTISALLRGDPASATARVAQTGGLVKSLEGLSPGEERLNAVMQRHRSRCSR